MGDRAMAERTHEHIWEPCSCAADTCHVEVCVWCEVLRSTLSGEIYDIDYTD